MNLSEKQKAPVVKKSVKNSVKKSNEPSLDWLETLGKQPLASYDFRQQDDELDGFLLPRWFCLLESDPDENDHFIKGYN